MVKIDKSQKCWICNANLADTDEHKIKKSNYLLAGFDKISQEYPLYYNDNQGRKNCEIGSTQNKLLTWQKTLCAKCNNARTQPHDKAWDVLLAYIYNCKPAIQPGIIINTNRTFSNKAKREMLNVHLYFVKLFGCRIVKELISIDIKAFSSSIMNCEAHPQIFLKFGNFLSDYSTIVGISEVDIIEEKSNGLCIFASWYYRINNLVVQVVFTTPDGEKESRLRGLWHPSRLNNFNICDFN